MRVLFFLLTSSVTIALAIILNMKIGALPPIAKFFNPFRGYLQNAEDFSTPTDYEIQSSNTKATISVYYDESAIPHVFAENDYDLYFAQGYVTAKDRLWQMDFQTRYAAGRLSEVVGKPALELDRYQRRIGMVYGAENMLKESLKDPKSKLMLEAYADGINAYIDQLEPADYPIEFKLLDYKPERWTPLNSALLLKLMSATLAGGSDELYMQRALDQYGADLVNDLFPNYPKREDPIIPASTSWDIKTVPIPQKMDTSKLVASPPLKISASDKQMPFGKANRLLTGIKSDGLGSNNWAISAEKTASGFPILANDPHLDLTLPSIWYQIQLQVPEANAVGVSIPGAPGIIIGYNNDIAWGVTNVGADVLDWYKLDVKGKRPSAYRYGDQWRKTTKRVERIEIRNETPFTDTVFYTHHGPIAYLAGEKPENFNYTNNIPEDHALKWVAHLPSNDLACFYRLNRAKNYDDYREALRHFAAPAQNFVYADRGNNIAITPNGYFPLKYPEQGKFILNGAEPSDDWHGRIPAQHNPTIKNPDRHFVSSANQSPVAPSYPYYLNWEYAPFDRAYQINRALEKMENADKDSFRLLQMDTKSTLADLILDTLVSYTSSFDNLNPSEKEAIAILKQWDRNYEADAVGASLFDYWYTAITDCIWSDKFKREDKKKMRYPGRDRTVSAILGEAPLSWQNNPLGATHESRNTLFRNALDTALTALRHAYGEDVNLWKWARVKETHVPHLADISGFNSKKLFIGGSNKTINAVSATNGPSWRMVVELGNSPTGYGILPGGASGNPGSKHYDDQLEKWAEGNLNKLVYLENPHLQQDLIQYTLTIKANP